MPADQFTNTITGTVPASFPVGSLISITSRIIIPSSFQVTADQIAQTSAANLRAASGRFNGVVYTFFGAPDIIAVTVDSSTTPGLTPTSISFTRNTIEVNDSGFVAISGGRQVLDITTAAGAGLPAGTLPEPPAIALLAASLAGLVGLGFPGRPQRLWTNKPTARTSR